LPQQGIGAWGGGQPVGFGLLAVFIAHVGPDVTAISCADHQVAMLDRRDPGPDMGANFIGVPSPTGDQAPGEGGFRQGIALDDNGLFILTLQLSDWLLIGWVNQ
jgi:hypothetical protein